MKFWEALKKHFPGFCSSLVFVFYILFWFPKSRHLAHSKGIHSGSFKPLVELLFIVVGPDQLKAVECLKVLTLGITLKWPHYLQFTRPWVTYVDYFKCTSIKPYFLVIYAKYCKEETTNIRNVSELLFNIDIIFHVIQHEIKPAWFLTMSLTIQTLEEEKIYK